MVQVELQVQLAPCAAYTWSKFLSAIGVTTKQHWVYGTHLEVLGKIAIQCFVDLLVRRLVCRSSFSLVVLGRRRSQNAVSFATWRRGKLREEDGERGELFHEGNVCFTTMSDEQGWHDWVKVNMK